MLHSIAFSPKRRFYLFKSLLINDRPFVLLDLSERIRSQILSRLYDEEIISLLHYVDFYQTTKILRSVSEGRRRKLIKELKDHIQVSVEFLMRFQPGTAANAMSLDYIEIEIGSSVHDIFQAIKNYEKETGRAPALLAVQDGFLAGEIPIHKVLARESEESIAELVQKMPSLSYNASERQVLKIFRDHPHAKIAVLDSDKSILGVIYSDDVLKIINEKSDKELYGFAGVSRDEDIFDSVARKVRNRYGWLIVNLGTAFLAASVVGLFQGTISKLALLAAYMPVVAGMGGNAAVQTLAVVMRGIASRRISREAGLKILIREVFAGALNGLITGGIVMLAMFIFHQPVLLGAIVAVSVIINLVIAGFFGTLIPLCLKQLGKDPASSAAIFITTATDVLGFLIFLGLARIFLV